MSRQGEYREPTREAIDRFWQEEAAELGETPQVTIRDHYFRLHEINTIVPFIPLGSRTLDIGCGTGFGTIFLSRRSRYVLGVDNSENMIGWARKLYANRSYRDNISDLYSLLYRMPDTVGCIGTEIDFRTANVLDLDLGDEPFDTVTGQRILINMPSHEDQMIALRQLRKYAHTETLLLLTEATQQGHRSTDTFRARFGLPILEKYWHNNYLDEELFPDWKNAGWQIKNILHFSVYMLLSKVVYPAACGQENCTFLSGANAAAMEMACLFRSKSAIDEIGIESFLEMYIARVAKYDAGEGRKIALWLKEHKEQLTGWEGLGHQKMIIAHAL